MNIKTLLMVTALLLLVAAALLYDNTTQEELNPADTSLCEKYAEQRYMKSKYEDGSRQYLIQGAWYDEAVLLRSCLGKL